MKLGKMLPPPIKALVILFAAQAVFAADGTWVRREGVGTGGTDWADWFDAENWQDGVVAGDYGQAMLGGATNQYINISSSVSIDNLVGYSKGYAVLRSDETIQIKTLEWSTGPRYVWLYAPYSMYTKSGENYAGLNEFEVCGPAVSQLNGNLMTRNAVKFRFDCFAESAGETRTVKAVPASLRPDASAKMYFIAPHGSDTNSVSVWSQTEGLPFLAPVGGLVAHALSVGTIVTGAGIPEGTFLKRAFPDGTIELSAAVTTTAAENALTFAAFAARTFVRSVGLTAFNSTGGRYINVEKYRTADELTVTGSLSYASNKATSDYTIDAREGYYPGILCLPADSAYAKVTLRNARLAFAGNQPDKHLYVDKAASSPELIVEGGKAFSVSGLEQLKGTLVKKGAGKLTLAVLATTAANMSGGMTVAEGTLALQVADGAVRSVETLTVAAGARFDVPQGGFDCTTLVCEKGAVIGGTGQLRYVNASDETLANLTVTDAAYVAGKGTPTGPLKLEFKGYVPGTYTEGDSVILIIESNTTMRVTGVGSLDAMIVAGGGGGGGDRGGGGGAGGVIITNALQVSEGFYGVAVGAGGTAGAVVPARLHGGQGGDSAAFGLVAVGGGGGGTRAATINGSAGGSGGGGGGDYFYNGARTIRGGAGTDGQGFAGGASTNKNTLAQGGSTSDSAGGGGGGAGEPGHNAPALGVPGKGGDGIECPFWKNHWFAGGGGGGSGSGSVSAGGKGGGGKGGRSSGYAAAGDGAYATGGGGGGGGCSGESSWGQSGAGGSGVVLLCVPRSVMIAEQKVYDDPIATGGDIRRRKGYAVHTFTQDGTFEVPEDILADVLVVGGGGGGGTHGGGGGGGGGVVVLSNFFFRAGSYPIAVGKGGGAGSAGAGGAGGASSIVNPLSVTATIQALGGGRGGMRSNLASVGGSGGGAGAQYYAYVVSCHTDGAAGTDGQGFGGGASTNDTKVGTTLGAWGVSAGGGGGGAGEPGADATSGRGGKGGDGVFCDFSGRVAYYGGGGGGGSTPYVSSPFYLAAGGLGGGGRGGAAEYVDNTHYYGKSGENGTDGLGGGGGGSGLAGDDSTTGGKGGDGVVIIRYAVKPLGSLLLIR